MAQVLDRLRAEGTAGRRPPLSRVSREEPLPLSFAQERTWDTSRTAQESSAYVMASAVRLRGPLVVSALQRSIEHIVKRHESLRTTFSERAGRPVQIVHPAGPVELPVIDVSSSPDPEADAARLLVTEAQSPFELARGPLCRLLLVRLGECEHQLLRVTHHIISDGWSWKVFFDELAILYEAFRHGDRPPLTDELALQYADFAAWERGWSGPHSPRHREQVEWWSQALRSAPVSMPLPFARASRRDDVIPADGVIWSGFPPPVSEGLDRLGRDVGATYYMVRLAGFAAALALSTGREDIVLGTYVTNRRLQETQEMFGLFTNLVTLRLSFDPELSVRQWLMRVRAAVVETSARAEIPYGLLVAELQREGITPPAIRTVFSVVEHPPPAFGGLEVAALKPIFPVMPWEFSFVTDRWQESSRCRATFDARVHDPSRVRSFLADLQGLAGQVGVHPDVPLGDLAERGAGVGPIASG
jgi:hypothetical protein